jgi:hypothetical protein
MVANGVEEFPEPAFQYDSVGFFGSMLDGVMEDPDYQAAFEVCASVQPE